MSETFSKVRKKFAEKCNEAIHFALSFCYNDKDTPLDSVFNNSPYAHKLAA
jgi:hypothetical protein